MQKQENIIGSIYNEKLYNEKKNRYDEKKIFLVGTIVVVATTLLISISYSILSDTQFSTIFSKAIILIPSYYFIGAILKFADDSFDEGRFPKKLAILFIVLGFLIAVWVSYYDKITSTIFASLVLATTLAGKTKEIAFLIGSITYIGTLIGLKILNDLNIIFIVIFGALLIDELCAEWAKKVLRGTYNNKNHNNIMIYFLRDRNIGIFTLFFLVVIGQIPILNWFAWLFLDFGYIIIEGISKRENIETILLRKVFVAENNNIPISDKNAKVFVAENNIIPMSDKNAKVFVAENNIIPMSDKNAKVFVAENKINIPEDIKAPDIQNNIKAPVIPDDIKVPDIPDNGNIKNIPIPNIPNNGNIKNIPAPDTKNT